MCDSCPPDSPQPAVLFCRQCKGNFCKNCDAQFHPPHNALMSRHIRLPIESSRSFMYCSEHPDEELSYYCLTCEGACICSECAIRGSHKGHDVQTIRRSYGEVRKRMNDLMTALATRQDAVKKILNQIEAHKQEIIDNTKSIKETMTLTFNELREKIRKKEMEFLASADRFQEEQIAELSTFITYATQKQQEIGDVITQMKTASEDVDIVSLLNYYGKTKPTAQALLKDTPVDIRLPQVASRRCYLDTEAANRQLEGLSGLHLIISSLQAAYSQQVGPESTMSMPVASEEGMMGSSMGTGAGGMIPTQMTPTASPYGRMPAGMPGPSSGMGYESYPAAAPSMMDHSMGMSYSTPTSAPAPITMSPATVSSSSVPSGYGMPSSGYPSRQSQQMFQQSVPSTTPHRSKKTKSGEKERDTEGLDREGKRRK